MCERIWYPATASGSTERTAKGRGERQKGIVLPSGPFRCENPNIYGKTTKSNGLEGTNSLWQIAEAMIAARSRSSQQSPRNSEPRGDWHRIRSYKPYFASSPPHQSLQSMDLLSKLPVSPSKTVLNSDSVKTEKRN